MRLTILIILLSLNNLYSQEFELIKNKILNLEFEKINLKQNYEETNENSQFTFLLEESNERIIYGEEYFIQIKCSKIENDKTIQNLIEKIHLIFNELDYKQIFQDKEKNLFTYYRNEEQNEVYVDVFISNDKKKTIELTLVDQPKGKAIHNLNNNFKKPLDYTAEVNKIYNIQNSIDSTYLFVSPYQNTELKKLSALKADKSHDEKPDSLTRKHIQFYPGTVYFKDSSIDSISQIANFIKLHPDNSFVLIGNTDGDGNDYANYLLSLKRSKLISQILIKYFNIEKSNLSYKGNGEEFPIYDNNSALRKSLNRRIDIINIDSISNYKIK